MGGLASGAAANAPDPYHADSEWEYEYDETETEDFYFTLDLTTHVPGAVPVEKRSRNGKVLKGKQVANTGDSALNQQSRRRSSAYEDDAPRKAGKLQFLDLHTREPFVKFNDDVYSCYWMTDLGTQFHVSKPGVCEEPLRPGNVLDVIGISQTRLVGKPVTLEPLRRTNDSTTFDGASASNAITVDEEPGTEEAEATSEKLDFSKYGPGQALVIPRDRIKNPTMHGQATFLERLSAIKLKKGENDIIPVMGVKFYDPPADQDTVRERAIAAHAAERQMEPVLLEDGRDDMDSQPEPTPKRRKRKSKAFESAPMQIDPTLSSMPALLLPRSGASISTTQNPFSGPDVQQPPLRIVQYEGSGGDGRQRAASTVPSSAYQRAPSGGEQAGRRASSEVVAQSSVPWGAVLPVAQNESGGQAHLNSSS